MLGLNLYALTYESQNHTAIEPFMTYPAPGLLYQEVDSMAGLQEALHDQLTGRMDSIVNEGAARGLDDRFLKVNDGPSSHQSGIKSTMILLGRLYARSCSHD